MDNYPISGNSLEKFYYINGNHFGQQYKEYLSNYKAWNQREHADKWMVFPENIGTHLSLDETSLSDEELYTVLTNKEKKGSKEALVAMVAGTRSNDITKVLEHIPKVLRDKVKEVTIDMANSMNKIVKMMLLESSDIYNY